jgi:hypothetical protein
MVDNFFISSLLLVVLWWLGDILYEAWLRHRSATSPTTGKPIIPTHKPARDSEPFLGLTCKPTLPPASKPQSLALQPPVSHPHCFPFHKDGRATWTALRSFVLSHTRVGKNGGW